MNETTVQMEDTELNQQIDMEELRSKLDELGIEFMRQHDDVYDIEALLRTWRDKRLEEFQVLKLLPRGVAIRRPATLDERLAYGLRGEPTYLAYIDKDGDLTSCFEAPEE